MLIQCQACGAKIRAPEEAAGKRVKCPKCTAVIQVPAAEEPAPEPAPKADPKKTRIGKAEAKSTRLGSRPPACEEVPEPPKMEEAPPAPEEFEEPEPITEEDATKVTAQKPRPSSKKPPPIKASKRAAYDEDEEESKASRKRRRDDEDDEEEDDRPRKRRSRRDDDDDDEDEDLSIRKRGRRDRKPPRRSDGLAMASMTLGIASIVLGLPDCCSCCCGGMAGVALICGIIAVVCAFMSNAPTGDSSVLTGKICGFIGIGLALALIGLAIFRMTVGGGIGEFQRGFNQGFNRGLNGPQPVIINRPPQGRR